MWNLEVTSPKLNELKWLYHEARTKYGQVQAPSPQLAISQRRAWNNGHNMIRSGFNYVASKSTSFCDTADSRKIKVIYSSGIHFVFSACLKAACAFTGIHHRKWNIYFCYFAKWLWIQGVTPEDFVFKCQVYNVLLRANQRQFILREEPYNQPPVSECVSE